MAESRIFRPWIRRARKCWWFSRFANKYNNDPVTLWCIASLPLITSSPEVWWLISFKASVVWLVPTDFLIDICGALASVHHVLIELMSSTPSKIRRKRSTIMAFAAVCLSCVILVLVAHWSSIVINPIVLSRVFCVKRFFATWRFLCASFCWHDCSVTRSKLNSLRSVSNRSLWYASHCFNLNSSLSTLSVSAIYRRSQYTSGPVLVVFSKITFFVYVRLLSFNESFLKSMYHGRCLVENIWDPWMLSSLADAPPILVASMLDRCFVHLLHSLGSCFVHPFSSNQTPSS